MALYTYEDAIAGKCEHWQVGTAQTSTSNEPKNSLNTEPKSSPKDTVSLYLDVFHRIGGAQELEKFAKTNPGKFYDQLLRLLISMEAPKQTMQVEISLNRLSHQEMDQMTSADIKRLLLKSNNVIDV